MLKLNREAGECLRHQKTRFGISIAGIEPNEENVAKILQIVQSLDTGLDCKQVRVKFDLLATS